MTELPFYFRKFLIRQDRCAMKVGTDAVLLGAQVDVTDADLILDIGTGTGIIAIMIAQRSQGIIDAIDIDEKAYEQAKENAGMCPWASRVNVIHRSLQEFAPLCEKKYDLIVSNPPYFVDAFKPVEEGRNIARHTDTLPFPELVGGVKKLLHADGNFCVILPSKEGAMFRGLAEKTGLFCNQIMNVRTKADKPVKRVMMCFSFTAMPLNQREMVIQNEDLSYTAEYIELTREYFIGLR